MYQEREWRDAEWAYNADVITAEFFENGGNQVDNEQSDEFITYWLQHLELMRAAQKLAIDTIIRDLEMMPPEQALVAIDKLRKRTDVRDITVAPEIFALEARLKNGK